MKKLLQQKGETLVETLASTLIITMMMIMVAGAVVAAARVNSRADNSAYTLRVNGPTVSTVPNEPGEQSVTFTLELESPPAGKSPTVYSEQMNGGLGASTVYHDHQEGKHDYYFFE